MSRVILTALISSDSLLGDGLAHILRSANYRIAGVAASLRELRIASRQSPEMLILVSPGLGSLVDTVAEVRRSFAFVKIVVLSERGELAVCAEVLRAGAVAYLPRSMSRDLFVESLDLVVAGKVVIEAELLAQLLNPPGATAVSEPISLEPPRFQSITNRLSDREAEVLQCLVRGDSNKHIGRRFDIAETTVKVHIRSVFRKIGASNRTQAAIWAINQGVMAPLGKIAPAHMAEAECPAVGAEGLATSDHGMSISVTSRGAA